MFYIRAINIGGDMRAEVYANVTLVANLSELQMVLPVMREALTRVLGTLYVSVPSVSPIVYQAPEFDPQRTVRVAKLVHGEVAFYRQADKQDGLEAGSTPARLIAEELFVHVASKYHGLLWNEAVGMLTNLPGDLVVKLHAKGERRTAADTTSGPLPADGKVFTMDRD